MTFAPFYKLWRKSRTELAITKASLTAAQRQFAIVFAERERARDFAVAAVEQAAQAEARTAELRRQLSSLLDVRAGFTD